MSSCSQSRPTTSRLHKQDIHSDSLHGILCITFTSAPTLPYWYYSVASFHLKGAGRPVHWPDAEFSAAGRQFTLTFWRIRILSARQCILVLFTLNDISQACKCNKA